MELPPPDSESAMALVLGREALAALTRGDYSEAVLSDLGGRISAMSFANGVAKVLDDLDVILNDVEADPVVLVIRVTQWREKQAGVLDVYRRMFDLASLDELVQAQAADSVRACDGSPPSEGSA